jgi:hypothetical protein
MGLVCHANPDRPLATANFVRPETLKGDPYLALHLTSESQAQAEKIKLAIWKNHEWTNDSDPHFQSVQEIFGRDFALQAWILTEGGKCQLALTIEPVADAGEVSYALQKTRQRIADFIAHTGVAALPPAEKAAARLPAGDNKSEEPDTAIRRGRKKCSDTALPGCCA